MEFGRSTTGHNMKSIFTALAVVGGILSFPTATTHRDPPVQLPQVQPIQLDLPEPLPLPEVKRVEFLQTPEREEWLTDLIMCESGGNPDALNPIDLDGTPSHGCLQFKDTTFFPEARRFGLEEDLYSCAAQKEIVRRWMDEPTNWEQQFPACVRKLGRPPGTEVLHFTHYQK